MKKILISLLLIVSSFFLFAQDKYIEQELNQKLNDFFTKPVKKLDVFIRSLNNNLNVELDNKLLKVRDSYSESIYECSFEISRILNYIEFYMEDYSVSIENIELDIILYIVERKKTFIEIPKDFLIGYYSADYKRRSFMIGQLLGFDAKK